MNLRKIYYLLPPYLRLFARRLYYFPSDMFTKLFSKNNELVPPKGMIFTGSGDFLKKGELIMKDFIDLADLSPNNAVLDIGSGIGRLATPLTKYLSDEGKYEGFDIVKKGVKWCQKNISKKYPNFRFQHIDLNNSLYNLGTEVKASNFKFPYQDDQFNFAFLISVFTHMMPDDVQNYLYEINRVLKQGGRCFFTCFIIDEDSKDNTNKTTDFKFQYDKGNYALMDEKVPEANIAFKIEYLQELISNSGLKVKTIKKGSWYKDSTPESHNFQDIVVLEKK